MWSSIFYLLSLLSITTKLLEELSKFVVTRFSTYSHDWTHQNLVSVLSMLQSSQIALASLLITQWTFLRPSMTS